MRVAAERLPGAAEVEVSLNEGVLAIRFEGGHPTTVARVREVVYSNGFTPREAEVRLLGEVVARAGEPALAVPGDEWTYALVAAEGGRPEVPRAGTRVLVEARMPETRRRAEEPPPLVVLRVAPP